MDLVKLITVANEVEAELVHSLLQSHGISSVIKGPANFYFPTSPLMRDIFVQESDLESARAILSETGTAE